MSNEHKVPADSNQIDSPTGFSKEVVLDRENSQETINALTRPSSEADEAELGRPASKTASEYEMRSLNNMISCTPVVRAFNKAEKKKQSS